MLTQLITLGWHGGGGVYRLLSLQLFCCLLLQCVLSLDLVIVVRDRIYVKGLRLSLAAHLLFAGVLAVLCALSWMLDSLRRRLLHVRRLLLLW